MKIFSNWLSAGYRCLFLSFIYYSVRTIFSNIEEKHIFENSVNKSVVIKNNAADWVKSEKKRSNKFDKLTIEPTFRENGLNFNVICDKQCAIIATIFNYE